MRITIRVRPGSARPGVGGEHDGALIVRVSARAVDGKATEAALTAVADSFGVRRSAVRLVSGAVSRTKIVDIDADDPRLLASLLATPGRLRPRRDVAAIRPSIKSGHMTRVSAVRYVTVPRRAWQRICRHGGWRQATTGGEDQGPVAARRCVPFSTHAGIVTAHEDQHDALRRARSEVAEHHKRDEPHGSLAGPARWPAEPVRRQRGAARSGDSRVIGNGTRIHHERGHAGQSRTGGVTDGHGSVIRRHRIISLLIRRRRHTPELRRHLS
jgi:uncharacterized protein YggU (UPF0235/DUF167 family)